MDRYGHINSSLILLNFWLMLIIFSQYIKYFSFLYGIIISILIFIVNSIFSYYIYKNKDKMDAIYIIFNETTILTLIMLYTFRDYGWGYFSIVAMVCLILFLIGVSAPDWDHEAVQKKFPIIWWLKYITHHRGHMHSIIGLVIYILVWGIILFFIMNIYFIIPTIACGLGYFSHLLEDYIVGTKEGKMNPLKLI